ncbi:hypothetical protein BT96DRAFT_1105843 [Gymnopus androsaceus JB14]|uniref:Uncharacterized protein n=1 Tax=Gymnopus androsaceus JB14 TaxID=1447944 RepID=A0A6A4HKI6_9AGAR|nr:hypothetical protein BT96DRAFT_1105843 [Gymnopus androsaceus JB14]
MTEPANPSSSWNTKGSAFASVIGTNHIPTTVELKNIPGIHPQHELSRLEAEIYRVKKLLSRLLSEKQKIEDYIEAHRTLTSPMRRIPMETLAEISAECLKYAV